MLRGYYMRGLRVVITVLLLASLVLTGHAQQTSYAGAAKIVLQIVKQGDVPQSEGGSWVDNGNVGTYVDSPPDMGPGYIVKVLFSQDPAIIQGQDDNLRIDEQKPNKNTDPVDSNVLIPSTLPAYTIYQTGTTFNELTPGTVIGINDYAYYNNTIVVTLSSDGDNALQEKISILSEGDTNSNDIQNTNSNDTQAPTSSQAGASPGFFSHIPQLGMGNYDSNIPHGKPDDRRHGIPDAIDFFR